MSDSVEKGIMLFAPSYLADQEDSVEHKPCDYEAEKENTENKDRDLSNAQEYPPDIQSNGKSAKADAEHQEEYGCLSPSHS